MRDAHPLHADASAPRDTEGHAVVGRLFDPPGEGRLFSSRVELDDWLAWNRRSQRAGHAPLAF